MLAQAKCGKKEQAQLPVAAAAASSSSSVAALQQQQFALAVAVCLMA